MNQWKIYESQASLLKKESKEWVQLWNEAYQWALSASEIDATFQLALGKALTRLKQFELAKSVLLTQLNNPASSHTKYSSYTKAICLQLGLIFFKERNYVSAINYYMSGLSLGRCVSGTIYKYIKISIYELEKENHDERFINKAKSWLDLLNPISSSHPETLALGHIGYRDSRCFKFT